MVSMDRNEVLAEAGRALRAHAVVRFGRPILAPMLIEIVRGIAEKFEDPHPGTPAVPVLSLSPRVRAGQIRLAPILVAYGPAEMPAVHPKL